MKHKYVIAFMGLIILVAWTSRISSVTDGQTKQDRLAPVVEWVLAEGKLVRLTAQTAHLLGIGDGSVEPQVIKKAYQKEDKSVHAFEVVKDSNPVVVLIAFHRSEYSIWWRTSKAGDLVRTIRIESDRVSVRAVPNADYADRFAEELKYWDAKVAEKAGPPEKSN